MEFPEGKEDILFGKIQFCIYLDLTFLKEETYPTLSPFSFFFKFSLTQYFKGKKIVDSCFGDTVRK